MKNNFKSYALILTSTIITVLISILPLGFLGIVASAVLSAIIGYTVIKYHYFFVATISVCIPLIYSIFTGEFFSAITVSLPTILCGLSLGISYNIKLSEFKLLGILTGIHTVDLLINIKILGHNNANILEELLSSSAKMYQDALSSTYGGQISHADINSMLAEILPVMTRLAPCFIVILCGLISLLMLYIFKKVLKFTKSNTDLYKPFSDWHADKSLSISLIFIIILTFFVPTQSYISAALENVFIISLFVFYIFGLSFIDFLLKRRITDSWKRKLILVLLVLFSFGLSLVLLCTLGLLDGFWNFREKFSKRIFPKQE